MNIKSLFKETALYGLSSVLGRFLNYLLVIVHTRFFLHEQDIYGQINEFYSYTGLLMVFFTYGMETGFFRFYNQADTDSEKRGVYSTGSISVLITTILFCAILYFFAPQIANYLEYPQLYPIVVLLVMILGLDTLSSLPFALLRQQNRPIKFVGIRLFNIFINIFLTLFFLVLCPYLESKGITWISSFYKHEWGIYYIFGSNLVASLLTLILLSAELRYIEWKFDKELWKKMLRYSAPLLIVGTAGIINDTFDRIMLKNFLTGTLEERNSLSGLYSAGVKIAVVITMFIQAFRMGAEPYFFKIAKDDNAKLLYARIMDYFVWAVCIIFLINCLYVDALKWIIAPTYYAGLIVVPIASLGRVFLGIYYNQTVWYKNSGHTMIGAWIATLGAACTIVMDVILIPRIGFVGAAWGSTIAFFVMMLTSYFLGQKYYPITYHLSKIFQMLFFAVFIFICFSGFKMLLIQYNYNHTFLFLFIGTLLLFIYTFVVYRFIFDSDVNLPFLKNKTLKS